MQGRRFIASRRHVFNVRDLPLDEGSQIMHMADVRHLESRFQLSQARGRYV